MYVEALDHLFCYVKLDAGMLSHHDVVVLIPVNLEPKILEFSIFFRLFPLVHFLLNCLYVVIATFRANDKVITNQTPKY